MVRQELQKELLNCVENNAHFISKQELSLLRTNYEKTQSRCPSFLKSRIFEQIACSLIIHAILNPDVCKASNVDYVNFIMKLHKTLNDIVREFSENLK